MTPDQFDAALRGYCRRRRFQPFVLEFTSGGHIVVRHPEAVRRRGDLNTMRMPDGGSMVFAGESAARLLDGPTPAAS